MCQVLHAEQFMGALALTCLQKNQQTIGLERFYQIENQVSRTMCIDTKSRVIMNVTRNDVYSTAQCYGNLFSIDSDNIHFFAIDDYERYYSAYFLDGMDVTVKNRLCRLVKKSFTI